MSNKNGLTTRAFSEFRAETRENGKSLITGIPIVFEQPTDIGGWFEETIARGAISQEVLTDIDFYYNHDLNSKPHARTRNGSLNLTVGNDGVCMEAEINRERSDSNDLYITIQDGNIDGMSFMFRVDEEEWTDLDTNYPKRRITKIGFIQEVSAVNYPAYEGTSISARANGENDKKILDEVRASKCDTKSDLELEKLKAKILFNI